MSKTARMVLWLVGIVLAAFVALKLIGRRGTARARPAPAPMATPQRPSIGGAAEQATAAGVATGIGVIFNGVAHSLDSFFGNSTFAQNTDPVDTITNASGFQDTFTI